MLTSLTHLPTYTALSIGWLEGVGLSTIGEWNTKLKEGGDDLGKVLEEQVVVGGVLLDPWHESLVLDQDVVGWQHHQALGGLVLVLLWTVPLLPLPGLLEEESVVVVGQDSWGESPRTLEAGAVSVAAAESVSTGKSNNLLVVKTHATEDAAEVVRALSGIWKTSVWGAGGDVLVLATWAVWDSWALHLLDGADTRENPEIGVRDPWELLCAFVSSVHASHFHK